jgi:hypothetical protein
MRPDGSDARKLAGRSEDPALSPDGRRIAFASDRDENGSLNSSTSATPPGRPAVRGAPTSAASNSRTPNSARSCKRTPTGAASATGARPPTAGSLVRSSRLAAGRRSHKRPRPSLLTKDPSNRRASPEPTSNAVPSPHREAGRRRRWRLGGRLLVALTQRGIASGEGGGGTNAEAGGARGFGASARPLGRPGRGQRGGPPVERHRDGVCVGRAWPAVRCRRGRIRMAGPRICRSRVTRTERRHRDSVSPDVRECHVRGRAVRRFGRELLRRSESAEGIGGHQAVAKERGDVTEGQAGFATDQRLRLGAPVTIAAPTPQNLTVSCAPGERALGGGVAPQSAVTRRRGSSTPPRRGAAAMPRTATFPTAGTRVSASRVTFPIPRSRESSAHLRRRAAGDAGGVGLSIA